VKRQARGWAALAERGSIAALRFGAAVYRVVGRPMMRVLLLPAAGYFYLTAGPVRRASKSYLDTLWSHPQGRKALARAPGQREVFRHVHQFAINLFDRFVAWGGGLEGIQFEHQGSEHLFRLKQEGRGAILLGSHLGSFDMMRLLAKEHELVINVLMFTEHAEQVNEFFERLDPGSRMRVIHMDPASTRAAFDIRDCLARGEFVGILGDRLPPMSRDAGAEQEFLGRPARFPISPYLLALVLGAPLFFAVCVRYGDATYRAVVEPLWDSGKLARGERDEKAREMLAAYVARLEDFCIEAPFQWFNFYDFWGFEARGKPS